MAITETPRNLSEIPTADNPGLPIGALISGDTVIAPLDTTIRHAAELLDHEDIGLLVLGEPHDVRTVLSERDIVRIVASGLALDRPVQLAGGQATLVWTSASATVGEVAQLMMEQYVRHVLVADEDGTLAGVVSMRDLLAVLVD